VGAIAVLLGFASLTPTDMVPVATPDDEKLYANYGETPFLGLNLSHKSNEGGAYARWRGRRFPKSV
jgi:hypothetical protein